MKRKVLLVGAAVLAIGPGGAGLAIAADAGPALAATNVHGHRGRLSITANPAGGLTVTVTLPRADHMLR